MNSGTRNEATRRGWRPGRGIASGLAVLAGVFLMAPGALAHSAFEARGGFGGQRGAIARPARPAAPPASRPARMGPGAAARPGNHPAMRPDMPAMRPGTPGMAGRPGQEHLPQWLAQHQNLSPAQQEDLLRRQPGFNRLTPDQQQRVLNRLRTLDARPPAMRERQAERNEMFERLSPEQKQDVRAAAQAFHAMPADRQAMMRRAFNDLRQVSPEQRQEILNSARFTHTYSPQERHVLGSLLSIEPYE